MKRKALAFDVFKVIVMFILIAILITGIIICLKDIGLAEEYEEAYVLCMPDGYVNVRERPNKKGDPIGYLYVGDKVYLDGKKRNGFLHCVNLTYEVQDGWVYKGYIVYDEPVLTNWTATIVSKGRLAARKCIDGKRTKWLKPMATVKVYYWTDEWCITNCGYVKSMYLEMDGE